MGITPNSSRNFHTLSPWENCTEIQRGNQPPINDNQQYLDPKALRRSLVMCWAISIPASLARAARPTGKSHFVVIRSRYYVRLLTWQPLYCSTPVQLIGFNPFLHQSNCLSQHGSRAMYSVETRGILKGTIWKRRRKPSHTSAPCITPVCRISHVSVASTKMFMTSWCIIQS